MVKKDKVIEFIEKEPELLKIITSEQHMLVLLNIFEKPYEIEKLKIKTSFKNVSVLYNILETLILNDLVKKIELNKEQIYYLTEKGKEFTKTYKDSKKKFDLNGDE